jgi:hypothetical protein
MLNFVNVNGDQWRPRPNTNPPKKTRKVEKTSFHKGWKVVGLPPGAEEQAEAEHAAKQVGKREPKAFDRQHWLMNARAKPVRAKPYELHESATLCADMARKAGWLRVEVVELKQEAEPKKENP